MSLQCASPQAAAQQSYQSTAAAPGGGERKALLTVNIVSSALPCTVFRTGTIAPSLCAAFDRQIVFCVCSSEEEETGEVPVLLFGPQGEEPVVDSTLQREGAALRG
ncbi:hypothetical protein VZT92_011034 [Zoarces viviparus]